VPFDSSNVASWCTDCNAKNQNSFWWTVLEKIRFDRQKGPKQLNPYCSFSWFFSKLFIRPFQKGALCGKFVGSGAFSDHTNIRNNCYQIIFSQMFWNVQAGPPYFCYPPL
jgi:hypothetical protein